MHVRVYGTLILMDYASSEVTVACRYADKGNVRQRGR